MTTRFYGSLIPAANGAIAAQKTSRISVAWWLIPSVMSYLLAIVIFR